MGSRQSSEDDDQGGGGPVVPCRPRTGINYALAIVYFLIGILLIIMAFLLPGLNSTNTIAIALVGGVQFLVALVHLFFIGAITRPAQPEAYLSTPEYAALVGSPANTIPTVITTPPTTGSVPNPNDMPPPPAGGGGNNYTLTTAHCQTCHRSK